MVVWAQTQKLNKWLTESAARLSLATSQSGKDKNTGEKKKKRMAPCSCINEGLVNVVQQYLKKGAQIYVEATVNLSKDEQSGQDKYSTEIVIQGYNSLTMLGRNSSAGIANDNVQSSNKDEISQISNDCMMKFNFNIYAKTELPEDKNIKLISMHDEMSSSYLSYAMKILSVELFLMLEMD